MKFALILGAVIAFGAFALFLKGRAVPTKGVSADDIPLVLSQLSQSRQNGHFAVFIFNPSGQSNGDAVNLQYSIENGVVGFDWVLLGPRNIADKAGIVAFATSNGFHLEEREMNNVHYLRATSGDLSALGRKIICEFYKIPPTAKLGLITEGFKWYSPAA